MLTIIFSELYGYVIWIRHWRANTKRKEIKETIIKRIKYYIYRERLEKLGFTTLQERWMKGNLIETFKVINGMANYKRQFFNISPQTGNLQSRQIKKNKSTYRLNVFANISLEQIAQVYKKNSNNVKKIKLEDFRKPVKQLKEYFSELLDKLLRNWTVYRYCSDSVNVFCKDSFF